MTRYHVLALVWLAAVCAFIAWSVQRIPMLP